MSESDKLLTVSETAKLTGNSKATIRRWLREGLLKFEYVGPTRRVRVRMSEVRRVYPNLQASA